MGYGNVRLVDEEEHECVSEGELWVSNESVEPCYLDDAMNLTRFHEGWLKTGDYFYRDEDGYFYWKGRIDDMFVCRGNNIYPVEIEKILLTHPAVEEAVMTAISETDGTISPAVLVKACEPVTADELISLLLRKGPAYGPAKAY